MLGVPIPTGAGWGRGGGGAVQHLPNIRANTKNSYRGIPLLPLRRAPPTSLNIVSLLKTTLDLEAAHKNPSRAQ